MRVILKEFLKGKGVVAMDDKQPSGPGVRTVEITPWIGWERKEEGDFKVKEGGYYWRGAKEILTYVIGKYELGGIVPLLPVMSGRGIHYQQCGEKNSRGSLTTSTVLVSTSFPSSISLTDPFSS